MAAGEPHPQPQYQTGTKMRTTLENLLMGIGRMHTTNQRTILERIQQMNDLLSSFMMNHATPQLGAWSCLINSESSNCRGQPRIGTTLTAEWEASTRMSQYIKKAKNALDNKQKHPMTVEHQRGRTYISNQVRIHACHLTLKNCTHIFDSL